MLKKVQNLNVNVQDLLKLSPSEKMEIFKTTGGARIVSQLTADQFAMLFPRYFLDRLKYDVSGFLQAMSPAARERLGGVLPDASSPTAGRASQSPTATAPSVRNSVPTWMKELEKTAPGASDPSAKAKLSDEQRQVIEQMRNGNIASDDPRASFIKRLSPEDRQKAGIQTVEQEGKEVFKVAPSRASQMTREEIIESMPKQLPSSVAQGSLGEVIQRGEVTPRERGTPNAYNVYNKGQAHKYRAGTMDFSNMSLEDVMARQNLPRSHPDKLFAVGAYQVIPTTMQAAVKGLGLDPRTTTYNAETQQKIFAWLSENKRPGIANFITGKNDNLSTAQEQLSQEWASMASVSKGGSSYYGGPNKAHVGLDVTAGALRAAREAYQKNLAAGMKHEEAFRAAITGVMPGSGKAEFSDEDVEKQRQALEKREEEQRTQVIAKGNIPSLPEGIDPKFLDTFNKMPVGQAQRVVEAINKMGVEKFNETFQKDPSKVTADVRARVTDTTTSPSDTPLEQSQSRVTQAQSTLAKTRRSPLQQRLSNQLEYAAEQAGVEVEVYSGGQAKKGTPGASRIGSERHDEGGAADLRLYVRDQDGKRRKLDMTVESDRVLMEKFVQNSVKAGVTGVGAGLGYMGKHGIHVGGGSEASWGGSEWIERARRSGVEQRESFNLDEWVAQRQEAAKKSQNPATRRVGEEDEKALERRLEDAKRKGSIGLGDYRRAIQAEETISSQATSQAPAAPAIPAPVGTPQEPVSYTHLTLPTKA